MQKQQKEEVDGNLFHRILRVHFALAIVVSKEFAGRHLIRVNVSAAQHPADAHVLHR